MYRYGSRNETEVSLLDEYGKIQKTLGRVTESKIFACYRTFHLNGLPTAKTRPRNGWLIVHSVDGATLDTPLDALVNMAEQAPFPDTLINYWMQAIKLQLQIGEKLNEKLNEKRNEQHNEGHRLFYIGYEH
jgi:hypothetical protein